MGGLFPTLGLPGFLFEVFIKIILGNCRQRCPGFGYPIGQLGNFGLVGFMVGQVGPFIRVVDHIIKLS